MLDPGGSLIEFESPPLIETIVPLLPRPCAYDFDELVELLRSWAGGREPRLCGSGVMSDDRACFLIVRETETGHARFERALRMLRFL